MDLEELHEKLERLLVNSAVINNELVNIGRRMDISNGRTAKLEERVEALKDTDIKIVNQIDGLTNNENEQKIKRASWHEFILKNVSAIMTALLIAYLIYRFGWR